MGSRYPRLIWAAPLMAALAVTLTAAGPPAADGPAVRSISGRLDGGVSTVLIESSEPVAYLTSQPDPRTVFVDLRNARTADLDASGVGAMQPPVSDVRLEPATAPDGSPVTRVRVALAHPARHRVRSSRNLIFVEVDRNQEKAPAARVAPVLLRNPVAARPEKGQEIAANTPQSADQRLATRLTGVKPLALPNGTAIAPGNGRPVASKVEEVPERRHACSLISRGPWARYLPRRW
jgi:hypothetical protein